MRILIFSTDDHLYPAGGAEQAMGEITKQLSHIEFDLICARLRRGAPKCERVGNVTIYRLGFGIPKIDVYILALFGHRKAYSLIKKQNYDLLWVMMASYGAFSAVRVAKKMGLPFLLTLQEGDPFKYIYKKVFFVKNKFKKIFQTASGLQTISKYLYDWGKEMGFKGKVAEIIPNGVDIENFTRQFNEQDIKKTRDTFSFDADAFILVTSSRLEPKNGIGDIINALPYLSDIVCFVICGSGSLEKKLQQQVKKLGLSERICFLGFVTREELPRILHASDIFVRPSLSEGLGNSFLEAMAARIPVVGTMVGGISDFLVAGKTGFVCEPNNPQSIVHAVQKIQTMDNSEKEKVLTEAYSMIQKKYNWTIIGKQMRELFQKTANLED
ncbi:glycosyltransferase family 4 protein [Patescibacteria group bacterium]|nr:glycosyltransferase family 4 protein [Patescibacteria group bacterium]MBU1246788.1 glycosyltransferase family 4 protein [Patescibacteria group bacterium]MBU1519153.1 glycosyltransferase family 4 protein [Patescibacteria group bacterium]MBU1730244.1 glycosyltransferase family 4 protein [Patescibacteria group bacterium]MBU1956079.1 glycosyltransferase family 4 protein [Patescibacteria group bacterium]